MLSFGSEALIKKHPGPSDIQGEWPGKLAHGEYSTITQSKALNIFKAILGSD